MNSSNKININYSSLMGLKAELMKKQAEVDAAKAKRNNAQPPIVTKPKPKKSEKNREKSKKLSSSEVTDIDDLKMHTKSKLMLEAKSRLYHNLKKSHTNANPNFLVDFANKSDSEDDQERKVKSCKENENTDSDFSDDDDWVEYTDCFGRSRKCLKEDLPAMKEKDRILSQEVSRSPKVCSEHVEDNREAKPLRPKSPLREAELEMLRKKWEAQMEKLADKTDIHYQDILFDEARSHGVGYYAFSQDEEERKKQQENLKKLRQETQEKQREAQEIRDKKLRMERNRLRAAKVRQKIRAGLSGELTEEEIAEIDAKYNLVDNANTTENKIDETKKENSEIEEEKGKNENSLLSTEDKVNAFRELLGKRNRWYTMSQEEWVDKRRKVRENEFAPMYDNFLKSSEGILESKKESSDEDEEIIGPMPPTECVVQNEVKKCNMDDDEIMSRLRFIRAQVEAQNKNT